MTPAIAIILARAGSKGVPGKNRAAVAGRPCVAWTIDDAIAATRVGRVCVSTDDDSVAQIAREHGVETTQRPAHLADDLATVDDAARDALAALNPEATAPVVLLYANVPLRPLGLIDRALTLLHETGCDSVQSYAPVGKHHPWWTARLDDRGTVSPWEGDALNGGVYRRQDLPHACIPDGGVLVVTQDALCHRIAGAAPGPHAFFGADRRGVMTAEGAVVDIDTRTDLIVADALLKERAEAGAAA